MAQSRRVSIVSRTRQLKDFPRQPVRTYLVPMVCKTIDIVELLNRERAGLVIEDIHRRTGYAKSSIYRIVRTLMSRGYVEHRASGCYQIASGVQSDAVERPNDKGPTAFLVVPKARERQQGAA